MRISPFLGALGVVVRNNQPACPTVATSTHRVTSTVTHHVTAQALATVTGAARCTKTVYAPPSVLTVPRVHTFTKTASATATSLTTSDFDALVTSIEPVLTAATVTVTITNSQTDTQVAFVTSTATLFTTVTSTSTAPTPTETDPGVCISSGDHCTIEDFTSCCSQCCFFPTGDTENGQCC